MISTSTARTRTNIGTRHPDLYRTVIEMARLAEEAASVEGLSPRLIELIKVRVSQINGCAFCLRMHSADALAKGELPDRLSVLSAWRETQYFDETERAALTLAEYATSIADSQENKELYEYAAEKLTSGQVSAVIWVAMAINAFNRIAISSSYKVGPHK